MKTVREACGGILNCVISMLPFNAEAVCWAGYPSPVVSISHRADA
jgi:hypothetical protein